MGALRLFLSYVIAAIVAYTAAAAFYTQQILSKQAEIGAVYTAAQTRETYLDNFLGLTDYGLVLAIALLTGFIVAAGFKRVVRPLAPLAYPIAGAAAVVMAIYLIETLMAGGGAGAIGGARGPVGLALQGLAGAIGGLVFETLRPRR